MVVYLDHGPYVPVACRFKAFMDRLLWDRDVHPEDIYRVKGMLYVAGSDKRHMLQVTHLGPGALEGGAGACFFRGEYSALWV